MSRTWTRRGMTAPPPVPGRCVPRPRAAAALLLALLLPSCHGSDESNNRIKPIVATLHITGFAGTPDPAVFLEEVSTTDELVTIDVRLHNGTGTPIDFDAYTLEFTYDFNFVQAGHAFVVNPAVLGDCNAETACDPLCSTNAADANRGLTVDANGKAHLVIGVAARASCPTASVNTDVTLLTLGFIAATTIPDPVPPNDPTQAKGRIALIAAPGHGDCEILQNVTEVLVGGQPISCVDGDAYLTAAR